MIQFDAGPSGAWKDFFFFFNLTFTVAAQVLFFSYAKKKDPLRILDPLVADNPHSNCSCVSRETPGHVM